MSSSTFSENFDLSTLGNIVFFFELSAPFMLYFWLYVFVLTSKSMESFSEKLSELDKIVRKMVVESLGLDKYMDEHMDSTDYLIRLQKYDKPRSQETELGLSSHTDKNTVTILYQNEINGLEVLTIDGHWFTPQPSLNSFIVMIGESFSVSLFYPSYIHVRIGRADSRSAKIETFCIV